MNTNLLKFLALVLGFAMWGALGYFGKVPLDPLIALLQMGLGGLITHMLQSDAAGAMPPAPVPTIPAAPPPAVAGRSLWAYPVLLAVLAFGLTILGGCASITDAGHSSYTVRAVTDKNSMVQGYTLDVNDGKEFTEGRVVQFQTSAEGATLMLQEGPSKAFKGQAIGAKALAVFPVTDLANILSGK